MVGDRSTHALIEALPKVDLHRHAEASARLDRFLARRHGRASYDWASRRAEVRSETPPGLVRLDRIAAGLALPTEMLERDPENMVARIADALEDAAADGAVMVEVRFGRATILYPEFMGAFRAAEDRVRKRYPWLNAEALITLADRCANAQRARSMAVLVSPSTRESSRPRISPVRWVSRG